MRDNKLHDRDTLISTVLHNHLKNFSSNNSVFSCVVFLASVDQTQDLHPKPCIPIISIYTCSKSCCSWLWLARHRICTLNLAQETYLWRVYRLYLVVTLLLLTDQIWGHLSLPVDQRPFVVCVEEEKEERNCIRRSPKWVVSNHIKLHKNDNNVPVVNLYRVRMLICT